MKTCVDNGAVSGSKLETEEPLPLLKDLRRVFTPKSVSAGIVAALFGCSGPALIVISAADAGNLSDGQTVAWLFSIYFLGACMRSLHFDAVGRKTTEPGL